MAKFQRNEERPKPQESKTLSKEELDAKHLAAMEAKSLIFWKSPVRIFKPRSQRYFVKVTIYGLVCILAAIAFGEYILAGVIIAIMFVVFVLAHAEPETIEHRITNMGIVSGGRPFLWEDLDSFWFEKKGDDRLLIVQTYLRFPSRLFILLTTVSERTLLDLLEKHLHYHEAPVRSALDKWATKLQSRINLE